MKIIYIFLLFFTSITFAQDYYSYDKDSIEVFYSYSFSDSGSTAKLEPMYTWIPVNFFCLDTSIYNAKMFRKDIKKRLNLYKPGQVIEWTKPSEKYLDISTERFINILEQYNQQMIAYDYQNEKGLFRIGYEYKYDLHYQVNIDTTYENEQ